MTRVTRAEKKEKYDDGRTLIHQFDKNNSG